ncbi:MAG: hypothetical protein U9R02_15160 [Thermodesulfobacteriota bacterium]|nr:hypothetical protein [Thermodesulfobacteriota bacterium]
MNTKLHLILLVLGFLIYSLFASSVAADNHIPTIEVKQIPSGSFQQKATEMCLADLPAPVREKISLNMQKAEYKVSGHSRPLPSGTKSIFRTFNRNQNLSAYFNERGVHFLSNGKRGNRLAPGDDS